MAAAAIRGAFVKDYNRVKVLMQFSEFVTIVTIVPETHADVVREAMGQAGAGEIGNYSHCSFSVKGMGRFKPGTGANPFLGEIGIPETVMEERIETSCHKDKLERVIEAIKKAHPYEEPIIDTYARYEIRSKKTLA